MLNLIMITIKTAYSLHWYRLKKHKTKSGVLLRFRYIDYN